MKKVLITGASGFIGKAITSAAAKEPDWEVYAVISGKREIRFDGNVHIVKADLTDLSQVEARLEEVRPDIIFHLAWNLGDRGFLDSESNLTWLETSLCILKKFVSLGGQHFFFAGSSAEYGYGSNICRETDEGRPEDLYGMCKSSFSRVGRMFSQSNGITFTSARIFSAYGVGERHILHIIPSAIDALNRGERFVCKAPENQWDFVYIDDIAGAAVCAAKQRYNGVLNIASGAAASIRELLETIAGEFGSPELIEYCEQSGAPKLLLADTHALTETLGYKPKVDLKSGIKQTVAWWKEINNAERN